MVFKPHNANTTDIIRSATWQSATGHLPLLPSTSALHSPKKLVLQSVGSSRSRILACEMEALKAVTVKPTPILANQTDPNKNPTFLTVSPLKIQSFPRSTTSICAISASRALGGGLALLSSFLSSGLAQALTYDEALQQSDFDLIRFAAENPIIAGGGVAVVAVPVVVAQILSKTKRWGVESAKAAYAKLGDDASAQLLDIRSKAEIKQGGSPNIRGLKKKAVAVPYNGDDKPGFLNKLNLKFKEPQNTTLFVLDKYAFLMFDQF